MNRYTRYIAKVTRQDAIGCMKIMSIHAIDNFTSSCNHDDLNTSNGAQIPVRVTCCYMATFDEIVLRQRNIYFAIKVVSNSMKLYNLEMAPASASGWYLLTINIEMIISSYHICRDREAAGLLLNFWCFQYIILLCVPLCYLLGWVTRVVSCPTFYHFILYFYFQFHF